MKIQDNAKTITLITCKAKNPQSKSPQVAQSPHIADVHAHSSWRVEMDPLMGVSERER